MAAAGFGHEIGCDGSHAPELIIRCRRMNKLILIKTHLFSPFDRSEIGVSKRLSARALLRLFGQKTYRMRNAAADGGEVLDSASSAPGQIDNQRPPAYPADCARKRGQRSRVKAPQPHQFG
jgi:hypothetical protein